MDRICVFCGSSNGVRKEYFRAARMLGNSLAKKGIEIVYGAGNSGLMGALADSALEAGGRVTGVTPEFFLEMDLIHLGLTDLVVVDTMHERKQVMADLAGGFIALPGGLGTLEEIFEALTWTQIGIHNKPCGLLNTGGFYDRLYAFLDFVTTEGFIHTSERYNLIIEEDIDRLLERITI